MRNRMCCTPFLALALLCSVAAADRVVLRDLTILVGEASKRADGKSLTIGSTSVDLDEVLLWEDDEGRLKYTPSRRAQFKALRTLGDELELERVKRELPKAVAAGAGDAARAMLERAERAGMDSREAEGWARKVDNLPAGADSGYKLSGRKGYLDALVDRARVALEEDERDRNGLRMLRAAFLGDEKYGRARDLLDEFAPDRFRIGDPRKNDIPRLWLDWQVDVLLEPGVRWLKRRHPDMERARSGVWKRTGIHGIETPEIVFITDVTDSRVVAMCMKYARMTCRALERLFATDEPKRLAEDDLPLVIYFYKNREEYLKYANQGSSAAPGSMLRFSAGFYVSGENVSRFFWPNRPNPELSIRGTFVHELTHHWIERRNPRWHARDLSGTGERVQTPGCWIVEGTATFIEEGRYNIETGRWSHFNGQAKALDIVAALSKEGKLLDWKKVLELKKAEMQEKLDPKKIHARYRTRWKIFPDATTEFRLFYEQSAAVCHYLWWAEDGKYRDQYKDYVTNYYTSRKEKTTIEAGFGMTPEKLGKRVEAFVRKVVDEGWRPDLKK